MRFNRHDESIWGTAKHLRKEDQGSNPVLGQGARKHPLFAGGVNARVLRGDDQSGETLRSHSLQIRTICTIRIKASSPPAEVPFFADLLYHDWLASAGLYIIGVWRAFSQVAWEMVMPTDCYVFCYIAQ